MALVNKKHLYFDRLSRTNKSLVLWAFADATVSAEINNGESIALKDEIAQELIGSLERIRIRQNGAYGRKFGAGSYKNGKKQFDKQYTPGLEFGVWKSTQNKYMLSFLARQLTERKINHKDYISIVMFNYIQIIDGKIISLLNEALKCAIKNQNLLIDADTLMLSSSFANQNYLAVCNEKEKGNIRGSFTTFLNILSETHYFDRTKGRKLKFNGDLKQIEELNSIIEKHLISSTSKEQLLDIIADFTQQQLYTDYITRAPAELIHYFNKYYSLNLLLEISKDVIDPIIINEDIVLKESSEEIHIPFKEFQYIGVGKKIDFIEASKRNSRIGRAAEQIVYQKEVDRIRKINPDLLEYVIWVSDKYGDGLGYDIQSLNFNENGDYHIIYIEVKATSRGKDTPIHITRNEVECSKNYGDNYFIYRIYDFNKHDQELNYFKFQGDLSRIDGIILDPTAFRIFMN